MRKRSLESSPALLYPYNLFCPEHWGNKHSLPLMVPLTVGQLVFKTYPSKGPQKRLGTFKSSDILQQTRISATLVPSKPYYYFYCSSSQENISLGAYHSTTKTINYLDQPGFAHSLPGTIQISSLQQEASLLLPTPSRGCGESHLSTLSADNSSASPSTCG